MSDVLEQGINASKSQAELDLVNDFFEKQKEPEDLEASEDPSLLSEEEKVEEEKILTFEERLGLTELTEGENNKAEYYERNIALIKFTAALKRLDETICLENDLLENYDFKRIEDTNARKTRAIYDLEMLLNEVMLYRTQEIEDYIVNALAYLKTNLDKNDELLKIHLEAVSELATMLQDAAQANESDGTYGPYRTEIEQNL